jgi:uncharacterized protein
VPSHVVLPDTAAQEPAASPTQASAVPANAAVEPQPPATALSTKAVDQSSNTKKTIKTPKAELPRKTVSLKTGSKPGLGLKRQVQNSKSHRLIFIIDDAGYSMKELEAFLELPFPLTMAVLPGLPNSVKAAKAIKAAGKELILHQPMQAVGGQNPGPGAITLGMSSAEVDSLVEANLATVPGAVGINNHMGSAASADLALMETVAAVAKRRGIYYLDSRTTSETAIPVAARREGIRYWERDVFLDNSPDRASITRAVEDGKKRSIKGRPAVMIGHVWSAELAQTLTDLYPQLIAEGYSLSTISHFMVSEASEDDESIGD